MTMKRNHKSRVQVAATSTELVRSASPRQVREFGRYLPLVEGRRFEVRLVRCNRTNGRTRATVQAERVEARRRAGRTVKVF
jgi:hypothetical protein